MRAKEFTLIEAVGLKGATPGEIYTDPNGVEYTFQKWHWQFPPSADAYTDQEEVEADILQQTGGRRDMIHWVNQWAPKFKSFAYAEFVNQEGGQLLIGKFFIKKSPNNTITDSEARVVTGINAGKKGKSSSSAIKMTANLKPAQVGIGDERARTIPTIIKAVSGHEQGEMLVQGLNAAISGTDIIFSGGAAVAPAIQDDFGEVLSPVAMIAGHPKVSGSFNEAVIDVFKGADLDGATIKYPVSLINGLVDSYIIKDGIELAVSSKGKKGANGSITNIYKAKEDSARTSTGQAYVRKFKLAADILDSCYQNGRNAPITLGLQFNLINAAEASALQELLKNPRDPAQQLGGDPANPNKVSKSATPEDLAKVPPELQRIFTMGGYKSGSFVGFLCLARVAKLVADFVNNDPKIDFGEAVRSFLNSSAMVQVKCFVKTKGPDAVVDRVNVVYPPNFKEKAKMESNWFSGRQIKGGFSFSLPST
jgi:hypothetical protein